MVATMAKSSPMLRELKPRKDMFGTEDTMYLMALGAMVETRMEVEARREAMFAKTEGWADDEVNGYDEVIIGGGPAAAAYAAARVLSGKPRPLVITDTLGGKTFSTAPWYRLNSSNRPGELGLSSEESALNVLPGSPIQGSMLNVDKYQDNTVQAFVTRSSLLRYADIRKGTAIAVEPGNQLRAFAVKLEDGGIVFASRVIDARGLGAPTKLRSRTSDSQEIPFGNRIMSVYDFADRFCQPFPFRDLHKVAVVGNGDTAKVTVEALLGTGPSRHMSVPMLDWVEQIDWYGVLPNNCEAWRDQERGRYQDLGSFLRKPDDGRQRLRVIANTRAGVDEGLDNVYVGGRPYDAVVVCIGFEGARRELFDPVRTDANFVFANDGRTAIAQQYVGQELYSIGVTANLGFDQSDPESTTRIENNKVALFRILPRVVQIAMKLPAIKPELEVTSAKALRTTRKLVGKDQFGNKIRLGDEVRYYNGSGIQVARGKAVRSNNRFSLFAIEQDGLRATKGVRLYINEAMLPSIVVSRPEAERLPIKKANRTIVGYDVNGEPLRPGDDIVYSDYDGDRIYGTVIEESENSEYISIRREGYNDGDQVDLDEDEYGTVEKR